MTDYEGLLLDRGKALAKQLTEQRPQIAAQVALLKPPDLVPFGVSFVQVVWSCLGFETSRDDVESAWAKVLPRFADAAPRAHEVIQEQGVAAAARLMDFLELVALASAVEARAESAKKPEPHHVNAGIEKSARKCPFTIEGICPPFWQQ